LHHAEDVMVDSTKVYNEVPQALRALREAGLTLAIVSTKRRVIIEAILEREGLRCEFAAIVGGEDVTRHKPDPSGLIMALRAMGSDAPQTVYVGDSTVDAETAERAGTRFVATLTGTTTKEMFSAFAVEAFIEHIGELPCVLFDLPSRAAVTAERTER
jgi:phosphoglycolate phosphatase